MPVLERLTDTGETEILLCFHCPGCGYGHSFRIKGQGPVWDWNGSMESPTFSPSLLVRRNDPAALCHSFVRGGKIEFLSDCHHALKGQTVPLPQAGD